MAALMLLCHLVIAASCFSIGVLLLVLRIRRKRQGVRWTYFATNGRFITFITFCGATHLTSLSAAPMLSLVVAIVAAAVALSTVAALWNTLPELTQAAQEIQRLITDSEALKLKTLEVHRKATT